MYIYIYKASKLEVQEEYTIFFKLQVKFGDFIVGTLHRPKFESLNLLSQLELGAEILRSQRKTVKSLKFSGKVLRGPGDSGLGLGFRV